MENSKCSVWSSPERPGQELAWIEECEKELAAQQEYPKFIVPSSRRKRTSSKTVYKRKSTRTLKQRILDSFNDLQSIANGIAVTVEGTADHEYVGTVGEIMEYGKNNPTRTEDEARFFERRKKEAESYEKEWQERIGKMPQKQIQQTQDQK